MSFIYDSENHKGYIVAENGEKTLIPSVTQLLELDYPMDSAISESVLQKASERGTAIHKDIELYNQGVNENCETPSGINYQRLVKSLSFGSFDTEKQILITNHDGEIIAYGTLDLILQAKETSAVAEKGELILADIKTVSQFNNEKVELQTNIYCLGYEQMTGTNIDRLGGIWVRKTEKDNIAQYRVFRKFDRDDIYEKVVELVERWKREKGV